jgi:hypothetical protein
MDFDGSENSHRRPYEVFVAAVDDGIASMRIGVVTHDL